MPDWEELLTQHWLFGVQSHEYGTDSLQSIDPELLLLPREARRKLCRDFVIVQIHGRHLVSGDRELGIVVFGLLGFRLSVWQDP